MKLVLDAVSYSAPTRHQTPIIREFSAELPLDRRVVILGPNGAGKSVLLRLCHGLLVPDRGRITWQGFERAPRQALVFQRPVLLRRSVLANVEYALYLARSDPVTRHARAQLALERVGLSAIAYRPARVLSGGEQQRLALARAWAIQPRVLFLDEPTSHLDPAAARDVEGIIEAIHRDGTAIVMTTHQLGQARRLGEQVVFIQDGRLAEQADADTFFARPGSQSARQYLEEALPWT